VNLRQELEPPLADDEIGLFVGPVVSFHEVGGSQGFWALAREVRDAVHAARSDHGPATALATQCLLLPRRATPRIVAKHLYHPLFGAIAVTNLGAPAIARSYGPLTLERLHVNPTSNPFGSLLSLSVTTVHGRMTVNFNYNERVLGEETIDALVAGVCERLQRGAEPPPVAQRPTPLARRLTGRRREDPPTGRRRAPRGARSLRSRGCGRPPWTWRDRRSTGPSGPTRSRSARCRC
jgi:hypothetical protein